MAFLYILDDIFERLASTDRCPLTFHYPFFTPSSPPLPPRVTLSTPSLPYALFQ